MHNIIALSAEPKCQASNFQHLKVSAFGVMFSNLVIFDPCLCSLAWGHLTSHGLKQNEAMRIGGFSSSDLHKICAVPGIYLSIFFSNSKFYCNS